MLYSDGKTCVDIIYFSLSIIISLIKDLFISRSVRTVHIDYKINQVHISMRYIGKNPINY